MTTGIIYRMTAAILNLQRDRGLRKGARMERLTFVTEDGEVLFHPEDLPDDEGVTITQLAVARRFRALETIAERLANREQAEEQGLLLRLPCNEVWFICDKGTKYATVMSKSINDLTVYEIRKIDKDGRYWSSKKKAEAKLAEMEGDSDGSME